MLPGGSFSAFLYLWKVNSAIKNIWK